MIAMTPLRAIPGARSRLLSSCITNGSKGAWLIGIRHVRAAIDARTMLANAPDGQKPTAGEIKAEIARQHMLLPPRKRRKR